jgi:hypothetical protein
MTQKFLIIAAAAATIAVTSLAIPSSVEAGTHHRSYGNFATHRLAPWYAPRYGYATPYRYYDRFGSNSNPDRQMVGIGE